jgi:hypothetical protein
MAQQEITLKGLERLKVNSFPSEGAKAGVDSVIRLSIQQCFVDDRTRSINRIRIAP